MKRIEAIVRPTRVAQVCAALDKIEHPGLSIFDIEGHGRQKGIEQRVQGKTYKVALVNKVRIEIVTKDEDVERITAAICKAALTGKVGDGKIFIHPVEDAIRIRTGERGSAALN